VILVGLQHAPVEIDLLALTLAEVELILSFAHICDIDLPGAVAPSRTAPSRRPSSIA
jgi:hypothetical protein